MRINKQILEQISVSNHVISLSLEQGKLLGCSSFVSGWMSKLINKEITQEEYNKLIELKQEYLDKKNKKFKPKQSTNKLDLDL